MAFASFYSDTLCVHWRPRNFLEFNLQGFPNTEDKHMAKCRVPLSQADTVEGTSGMMRLPYEVLSKRLGRPLRHKKLASIHCAPRYCNGKKSFQRLTIHQDYLHRESKGRLRISCTCTGCLVKWGPLETVEINSGSPSWKRKCCPAAVGDAETDNIYCLLRDTGFVEAVEDNPLVFPLIKYSLALGMMLLVLGMALKWLFNDALLGQKIQEMTDFDFDALAVRTTNFSMQLNQHLSVPICAA